VDSYTYMTNQGLERAKLHALHADDPYYRPRVRQRDVTRIAHRGEPLADIRRTMGLEASQSKYTGESSEEHLLRLCHTDPTI